MDHSYSGGNWTMIPNMPSHSNSPAHSNQDQFYLQQQQQQQFSQFQQPQQQLTQQFQQQQQQYQQQRFIQQQQQPQQNPHHQSLSSQFHLIHLVENLADVIENGTRDHHSDALVVDIVLYLFVFSKITELSNHFDNCQQLLNSISSSINTKAMTVEGQKQKLEESEQLLNQRRDLISKYRNSIEELIKSEP